MHSRFVLLLCSASASFCQESVAFLCNVPVWRTALYTHDTGLWPEFFQVVLVRVSHEFRWHCSYLPKLSQNKRVGTPELKKKKTYSKLDWCECTLLSVLCANSLPSLVSRYMCRPSACLDWVWKWISPIHHHCARSAVTRVMPFVKLKWDHGNIQLSVFLSV